MDAIVRATCPTCKLVLRIPAQWIGQAVKCKKCGSVVRSKPIEETPTSALEITPAPNGHYHPSGQPLQAQRQNAFDFTKPAEDNDPFPLPEPAAPTPSNRAEFDPFPAENPGVSSPPETAPPGPAVPGYPYPMPPGYPQPGAYAPPPGYPYPMPPGYPYPIPPGYGQPGAYAFPPGYPYPMPPGYGPPGAYAIPPGHPYPVPPEGTSPPPTPSVPNPQALLPNGPVKPTLHKPRNQSPVQIAPHTPFGGNPAVHAAFPDPVPPSNEFKTDAHVSSASPRRYQRGGNGKGKIVWISVCVVMTLGLVTAGIIGAKYLKENYGKEKITDPTKLVERLGSADAAEREEAIKALKEMGPKAESALRVGIKSDNSEIVKRSAELLASLSGASNGPAPVPKSGSFPRRLLFIHISKYMYLNPLTASDIDHGEADKTKSAALRMAYDWRIPADRDNNQWFLLSDSAPPEKNQEIQIPLKSVVMGAYERFFETSRAQDHIVVYFGGHMLEREGKAYIAPVECDPDEPDSFIPLEDFYAKFNACKATQKVVIWDVCRFNPNRGRQRPGADPMTESLAKSLADAPPGIEVIATCQPGENALEFYSVTLEYNPKTKPYSGSSFLESARYVAEKNKTPVKAPAPNEPIAVSELVASVTPRLNAMAAVSPGEQKKQTLKLDGKMPSNPAAYNPEEPPAKRFDIPVPQKGTSLLAIKSIEREFVVPPIKSDARDTALSDLPYKEEIMKDYKSEVPVEEMLKDQEKYRFQVTVLKVFDTVREVWAKKGPESNDNEKYVVQAPITDAIKKTVFKELEFWAEGIARLELIRSELESLKTMKESQSKRWQAHYEYARAVLNTRLAYMNEYDKLMGDIRTENLPQLDKAKGQNQYKLVSSEKMKSKKDVQKLADEAQEAYNLLLTEHKGTPWAVQAKREKSFSLGLVWTPSVGPGSEVPTP